MPEEDPVGVSPRQRARDRRLWRPTSDATLLVYLTEAERVLTTEPDRWRRDNIRAYTTHLRAELVARRGRRG